MKPISRFVILSFSVGMLLQAIRNPIVYGSRGDISDIREKIFYAEIKIHRVACDLTIEREFSSAFSWEYKDQARSERRDGKVAGCLSPELP